MKEKNNNASSRFKKIIIVGGGTAGWMAAAAFAKTLGTKHYSIQLIESEDIGTVGVGEATIPSILEFNKTLGLDEREFMKKTHATFKLGIEFRNWGNLNDHYIHPFGSYGAYIDSLPFYNYWLKLNKQAKSLDMGEFCLGTLAARNNKFMQPITNMPNSPLSQIKYAYHFDAGLYAKYLRNYAEMRGIKRIEGEVTKVKLNNNDGFIESLLLKSGASLEADFFIDCSGFRGLLIEGALKTGYEDWNHLLLCDSAIAAPSKNVGKPPPYTRAIAQPAGWQWRIPLQHRTGNGHVYASRFMSDDDAKTILLSNIEGELLSEPKLIRYKTGIRRKFWNKNCVAIGLSSGFLEPLESTSIHLTQKSITLLLDLFPSAEINQENIKTYNEKLQTDFISIRDFIIFHYKVTQRSDSAFWRHCRTQPITENLNAKIKLFEKSGRIFQEHNEFFSEGSWFSVMQGQGLIAQDYNPIVDILDDIDLENYTNEIKAVIKNSADVMPTHADFIEKFCSISKQL